MDAVNAWIDAAVNGPWMLPALFILVVADAFVVVLPSETVVVALGSLALSTGSPNLLFVVPVAALGAMVGDNLCYFIGLRIGTTRFRWMRGPRITAAIDRARLALDRRAAALILTARYIPFARIAANLTAGATHFSYRRYFPLTIVAGLSWALYNSLIGALFGAWLGANPILAVVVSVVVAISLGVIIDAITARMARARATAAEASRVGSGDRIDRRL